VSAGRWTTIHWSERFGRDIEVGGVAVSRAYRDLMIDTVRTFAPGEIVSAERRRPQPRPVVEVRYLYLDADRRPLYSTDTDAETLTIDAGPPDIDG
jgi:hypothetical protein